MASSARTFGKGRVLGASLPASTNTTTPDRATRRPRVTSPSGSSLSLESQNSTSKSSNDGSEDISAAVALHAPRETAEAWAVSRLVCPICNEEMMTLLQLNRHLDDDHKNLEDVEQDEVKTWFKTQVIKARKFQPLAVLNQKLKGLDVFESNEDRRPLPPVPTHQNTSAEQQPHVPLDPDEYVTREHWQRPMPGQLCLDPMCGKRLGGTNGNIHCRKCGKLFCEEHTMYQMKLSRSANHEPVRGYWCRVCETCYKSRAGYNDHSGVERSHTAQFASLRRKAVDRSYLDTSRLEKRLTKLTSILADPRLEQEQTTLSYLWSFSGAKSQQRLLEESVVDWEDDARVQSCPFCKQEFTQYTFRRHHCRTCGRVVCADPSTGCSSETSLDVARNPSANNDGREKGSVTPVLVRMCRDCNHSLFSKSDFLADTHSDPADQRAFRNLKQFEGGIRLMLPRFQRLLTALQDPDVPPTPVQLAEATKVRRRLTDSFTQYDTAARRIRDLPTTSTTQQRLQKQIHAQASQFLHLHMLPLKQLPKTLKHATATTHSHSRSSSLNSVATVNGHLSPSSAGHANHNASRARSPLIHAETSIETASQASSSRLTELETEEGSLRERLIVLEEQRFLVQEMLSDARRRRKAEEVDALGRNVDDLGKEIAGVVTELGKIEKEVRGIHTGTGSE